jgi:hypothetical protein
LITGNDEKVWFDETGKTINQPPGKDTVSIIDIHDPIKPRIVANLSLMNTIIGPPVNLAITPDQHLALVANSLDWVRDGESWKGGRAPAGLRARVNRRASSVGLVEVTLVWRKPFRSPNPSGRFRTSPNHPEPA